MRPNQGGEAREGPGLAFAIAPIPRMGDKTASRVRFAPFDPVRRPAGTIVPGAAILMEDIIKAVVLGIVEGLTEYLPVSSTGHLLLIEHFFGFDDEDFGKTFAVLIQLGAILALLSIYFVRLLQLALGFFTDPAARRFVFGVLIAFLPAAVVGALAHDFIKGVLFNPWIVCFVADRRRRRAAVGRQPRPQAALPRRRRRSRCRCISSSACSSASR